ncbi:Putative NAD(P)H nitroreductase YdjA [Roseivivax jejudonensis]|uniref:Putative NAD(P)H nitroreductase n=1 Tax=Roseivivax jejudonensis TaxID=1529041 RepID=A0A1X6YIX3_9RHOB|nr:nitroreductase family protein [Roseivivax jejudonensis]SLN23046.1 Putative NAD(P)H nitroreductase YdjA [Roseivivax jejudonensis]
MPHRNDAALDFLLTRRSRPAKTLRAPAPDDESLREMLTAAARSPDHGKLEPWRFLVLREPALARLAEAALDRAETLKLGAEQAAKGRAQFADSPLCVAVVEIQRESAKIPPIEQTYSAGAVCLALLNAALAAGWGANWLSGWVAHDRGFVAGHLGLEANERIAGFVHIGTEGSVPPERPRPDIEAITTWVEA